MFQDFILVITTQLHRMYLILKVGRQFVAENDDFVFVVDVVQDGGWLVESNHHHQVSQSPEKNQDQIT